MARRHDPDDLFLIELCRLPLLLVKLLESSARFTYRPVVCGLPCFLLVSSDSSPLSSSPPFSSITDAPFRPRSGTPLLTHPSQHRWGVALLPPVPWPPLLQGDWPRGRPPFYSSSPPPWQSRRCSCTRRRSRPIHSSSESRISSWSRQGPVAPSLPLLAQPLSLSQRGRACGPHHSPGPPPSPLRCYACSLY